MKYEIDLYRNLALDAIDSWLIKSAQPINYLDYYYPEIIDTLIVVKVKLKTLKEVKLNKNEYSALFNALNRFCRDEYDVRSIFELPYETFRIHQTVFAELKLTVLTDEAKESERNTVLGKGILLHLEDRRYFLYVMNRILSSATNSIAPLVRENAIMLECTYLLEQLRKKIDVVTPGFVPIRLTHKEYEIALTSLNSYDKSKKNGFLEPMMSRVTHAYLTHSVKNILNEIKEEYIESGDYEMNKTVNVRCGQKVKAHMRYIIMMELAKINPVFGDSLRDLLAHITDSDLPFVSLDLTQIETLQNLLRRYKSAIEPVLKETHTRIEQRLDVAHEEVQRPDIALCSFSKLERTYLVTIISPMVDDYCTSRTSDLFNILSSVPADGIYALGTEDLNILNNIVEENSMSDSDIFEDLNVRLFKYIGDKLNEIYAAKQVRSIKEK